MREGETWASLSVWLPSWASPLFSSAPFSSFIPTLGDPPAAKGGPNHVYYQFSCSPFTIISDSQYFHKYCSLAGQTFCLPSGIAEA